MKESVTAVAGQNPPRRATHRGDSVDRIGYRGRVDRRSDCAVRARSQAPAVVCALDSDRRPIDGIGSVVRVLRDRMRRRGHRERIATVVRMLHRQFEFPERHHEQQHQESGRKPSSPNPTDQSHDVKIATRLRF